MKRIGYHILIPVLVPIAFFSIALTPVHVLGCLTRGLIAASIALMSGLAALAATIIGTRRRTRGDSQSIWWVVSAAILVIPVIALIMMA
jgi:hypothetical protein